MRYRQNVWRFCELFADALPALQFLRASGTKLAVITNGTVECQQAKTHQLGLTPLVNVVLISERENLKKPSPELFVRACELVKLSVGNCLMVGDSLEADVEGLLPPGYKPYFWSE